MRKVLSIDIETYSSVDLIKSGVYAYADASDFEILLFAYAFDDESVKVVDLATGDKLPIDVMDALTDENIIKTAYNANFERCCISKFFGLVLSPKEWQCTAVWAAELGLPQTLKGVSEVLGLEEQKDSKGRALIRYFCTPCKASTKNEGRTRNYPIHNTEKWEAFKDYCRQDVIVEREIKRRLAGFPIAESEQKLWELDQRINDRGVMIDVDFVKKAIEFDDKYSLICTKAAQRLTGLENVNSVAQLKKWIFDETGETISSLDKKSVEELMKRTTSLRVKELLRLRVKMSKTSISKYEAMARSVCNDGRIRGLLQFYGANRTGRWAGRIVQVQNLPKNHLKDLDYARDTILKGDYELFEMLYDKVPSVLSELIRTALIAEKGKRFIVADFSAIEARVIAYLANEKWRIEVFNTHGKIYEASAAQMFKVPISTITKGSPLRQKGKIAELALGYGGGVSALIAMGGLEMGLEEDELNPLVQAWRIANPNITKFWKTVEKAAINAINDKPSVIECGIGFIKQRDILFVKLPSGRSLAYVKPEIGTNKFGSQCLTYMGMNQTKKVWERDDTWGGKLVENIVQAVARDCLAESMQRISEEGFEINFHVHDEVIIEAPFGIGSVVEVTDIMSRPIQWAKGLNLTAEGYETVFYKKD